MPWCHLCQSCTDLQHLKSTIGELVVYIIPFAHLIVPSLQHILFYPPPPKVPGIEDDLFMLSLCSSAWLSNLFLASGLSFPVLHFRARTVGGLERLPDGRINYAEDFFAKPSYLTVSGQMNAEYYACALSNVYTFGPTFRCAYHLLKPHLAVQVLHFFMMLCTEFLLGL